MHAQVVQDHHLPWPQGRPQAAGHLGVEGEPVHRARAGQGPAPAVPIPRRDQRHVRAVVARHPPHHSLAPPGPPEASGQAQSGPRIIDKDQGRRIDRGERRPPGGPPRLIPLAGEEDLCLSVIPHRRSTRDIVAARTRTPGACSHWAPCAARVESGRAVIRAFQAVAWTGPMRGERPGRASGARSPPVARRARQRGWRGDCRQRCGPPRLGGDRHQRIAAAARGGRQDIASSPQHRTRSTHTQTALNKNEMVAGCASGEKRNLTVAPSGFPPVEPTAVPPDTR